MMMTLLLVLFLGAVTLLLLGGRSQPPRVR